MTGPASASCLEAPLASPGWCVGAVSSPRVRRVSSLNLNGAGPAGLVFAGSSQGARPTVTGLRPEYEK